jgi:hypothetical protein
MPSLGRWKSLAKSRSGRRPISVGKLLEKERAGTLFKKHSSTRALREVLRELPEVAADYRAAKGTKTLAGAGAGDVLKRFGLSQAADPAALTTERVNQPLADLFKSFKGRTVSREAEARFEQASRSSWSGRHAPRPGETTIPAGVSGEMVVSNPSKDHIFRGNPVSGGDANYFSRHPEVAAGYATGHTAKQYGVPSKRLFVYENPGGGVESAADAIRPAVIPKAQAAGKLDEVVSEATAAALARQKGLNPNSPLRSYGRLVPTYETLHAGAVAQGMKPKGEYAVRPVRLGKEPGYAISDVSGAPASSIFQKHAGGRAHGVKHDTPYGYIRGTTGADDEEVDCYVGPNRDADTAYVVHQKNDAGGYDEDTIMLGYDSEAAAKADILRHYSDPKYVGDISPISMEELHALLSSGEKLVEIGREKTASDPRAAALMAGAGGAITLGGTLAAYLLNKRLLGAPNRNTDDDHELMGRVETSSSTPVERVDGFDNAMFRYSNKASTKELVESGKIPKFIAEQPIIKGVIEAENRLEARGEDPRAAHVLIGKNFNSPAILAHELGHAEIHDSKWGRLLQNRVTSSLGNAKVPIAMLGGAAAATGNPIARNVGIGAAALAALPELAYEGLANVKGYKRLKEQGATPEQLSEARKTLLSSYGTYAGQAAAGAGSILSGHALSKLSAQATHDHDYSDNDFGMTGSPARLPRHRLELPVRDEPELNPTPKVEQRQDSQGTLVLGDMVTPGAFLDTGKISMPRGLTSHAMETLGELSRSWEVPSIDEERGGESVDHHGPFGVTLSDISAAASPESPEATRVTKTASMFEAFVEELGTLNAVTPEQLQKVAEVTREQAQAAMLRLDELEHQKPTLGQLGRGAAVGSIVGPIASNVNKLISKGEFNTPREIAGQIAGGAIFGIATPLIKHRVETGTERHALRDYVNQGHGGRLATQIENKLETP